MGRTGGFGKEGNADVFRVLIEDGTVVRTVNLTKSEEVGQRSGLGHLPASDVAQPSVGSQVRAPRR